MRFVRFFSSLYNRHRRVFCFQPSPKTLWDCKELHCKNSPNGLCISNPSPLVLSSSKPDPLLGWH
ncbi:uncharacterized protein BO87DRAFT_109961 [Aspergillus neoniger CBS 115656]|uniref:Uncharacterized protein n=1 Tax=Aspergillus neoniger (strain CBS 115656) TaxID=1448310 RepID=A0A318YDM8_ASPNB|nr:hypothetical protein BO87DRAFT_109961 [Aspergillus neoniger CBS 115656]PYH32456.1 hypothetical protein BO87DRAFT_109961 [Aspergillus neoniger CBS 115656]